jgi:hypothetical protein
MEYNFLMEDIAVIASGIAAVDGIAALNVS